MCKQISLNDETRLFEGQEYLHVTTPANPGGEVRGQMVAIDKYPTVAFTARLESRQVVPSVSSRARGCSIVTYDCVTGKLEYLVYHNVPNALSATIFSGTVGSNGAPVVELSRIESPITGFTVLSYEDEYALYSQELYIVIGSAAFPDGEVRGQLTTEYDFFAYLSGTWVTPPVSTAAVGCAVFKLDTSSTMSGHKLSYGIHHGVRSERVSERARVECSRLTHGSTQVSQPISVTLNKGAELEDWLGGKMYLSVTSAKYPNGELRGQVYRIGA